VLAWADEGHQIVALVADRFLEPAVRAKIATMLAADSDNLTPRFPADMKCDGAMLMSEQGETRSRGRLATVF
jgi:hypothetical protein